MHFGWWRFIRTYQKPCWKVCTLLNFPQQLRAGQGLILLNLMQFCSSDEIYFDISENFSRRTFSTFLPLFGLLVLIKIKVVKQWLKNYWWCSIAICGLQFTFTYFYTQLVSSREVPHLFVLLDLLVRMLDIIWNASKVHKCWVYHLDLSNLILKFKQRD